MKTKILLLCLVLLPGLAQAEIYKWRDKDGSVRYSDVPPPSNIKQESMYGTKIPKPTNQPPLAPVKGNITEQMEKANEKASAEKAPMSKEDAAAKRAKDAEQQKLQEQAKAEELKAKQEYCKVARANLQTYNQGGRVVKVNERGEREFLNDADIAKGKADAQSEIDKYCN